MIIIKDKLISLHNHEKILHSIVIPPTVCTIKNGAFQGNLNIEEVIFSDGIRNISIEKNAFSGCKNLKKIVFGDKTIVRINKYAFSDCGFTHLDLSNYKIVSIGDGAFQNCLKLTALNLPIGIQYLGKAFIANTNIKEIDLKDSPYVEFADYAFSKSKLIKLELNTFLKVLNKKAFVDSNIKVDDLNVIFAAVVDKKPHRKHA